MEEVREEAPATETRAFLPPLARADLHLHTNASIFKYFRAANSRDSYSDPDEVYRLAKARGMDFVTFTDHDTVDGCLKFQDRRPELTDFFVSAEIETRFPKTGHRIHVNVFDLGLPQWQVINRKRRSIHDLVEYLRAESLLYSANHLFQSYRMRQAPEDFFTEMLELFDVFEVKNGSMAYQHNALVEDLLTAAKRKNGSLALIGGSDAHTYPPVASVFTMAPGGTWREFLASVREGRCLSWGSEMGFTTVLTDVYKLLGRYYRSVTDFRNPEFTRGEKARHFLLAVAALPINLSGFPAAIWSLNYAKQVALSKTLKNRFTRKGLTASADGEPEQEPEPD
jgi:predicted metal-dependent phosphoesterase TrpH